MLKGTGRLSGKNRDHFCPHATRHALAGKEFLYGDGTRKQRVITDIGELRLIVTGEGHIVEFIDLGVVHLPIDVIFKSDEVDIGAGLLTFKSEMVGSGLEDDELVVTAIADTVAERVSKDGEEAVIGLERERYGLGVVHIPEGHFGLEAVGRTDMVLSADLHGTVDIELEQEGIAGRFGLCEIAHFPVGSFCKVGDSLPTRFDKTLSRRVIK